MDLIDRQAAIEHLRNNIAYMRAFGCDRAITLIREVPSVQSEERTDKRAETHACDLISRQAAIDAVADGIISEEESLVECARECNSMIEWAVEALKELPSVQEERTEERAETHACDLISRQAAIDLWVWGDTDMAAHSRVVHVEDIEALPSAQPEIIRCKDCKHRPTATRADEGVLWGFSVEFPDERCPLQCEDGWYNHYPEDDFYCANAERRTDALNRC